MTAARRECRAARSSARTTVAARRCPLPPGPTPTFAQRPHTAVGEHDDVRHDDVRGDGEWITVTVLAGVEHMLVKLALESGHAQGSLGHAEAGERRLDHDRRGALGEPEPEV